MSDTTIYRLLRKASDSGGTKDWAVGVSSDGTLMIRFGKTDANARLSEVPMERCRSSPAEELVRRLGKKIQEGYEEVGQAKVNTRGRLEVLNTSDDLKVGLYWDVSTPIIIDDLSSFISNMVTDLGDVPGADIQRLDDSVTLSVTVDNRARFVFGVNDHGGLSQNGRGGGVITADHGPIPILVLMALIRRFPENISVGDHEGNPVDLVISKSNPYLESSMYSIDELRDIGSRLQLCMQKIRVSSDNAAGLWF